MEARKVQVAAMGDQRWAKLLKRVGRGLLCVPRQWAWLPPLAWAGLIVFLSSCRAPLSALPGSSLTPFLGNMAHSFEFGVLFLLLVPLLPRAHDWVIWSPMSARCLPALAFLYAFSDEFHQSRVPGRDASLLDLCTDLAGILSVYWVVRRLETPDSEVTGLKALLGKALVICALCAGLSTLWAAIWTEGPWPFPA